MKMEKMRVSTPTDTYDPNTEMFVSTLGVGSEVEIYNPYSFHPIEQMTLGATGVLGRAYGRDVVIALEDVTPIWDTDPDRILDLDVDPPVAPPVKKEDGLLIILLIVVSLLAGCGHVKGGAIQYAKDALSCVPEALKAGLQCIAEKVQGRAANEPQ